MVWGVVYPASNYRLGHVIVFAVLVPLVSFSNTATRFSLANKALSTVDLAHGSVIAYRSFVRRTRLVGLFNLLHTSRPLQPACSLVKTMYLGLYSGRLWVL
ncbi:hypothetical protein BDW69DRAFT_171974 [Aspergillus filifer]